jgi:hypothetical protein
MAVKSAMTELAGHTYLSAADRSYFHSMIEDGSLEEALRGGDGPDPSALSTIDTLLKQGRTYQTSRAFKEMIEFMGRFRDYAPYNNMLVRVQNPSCSFFAREKGNFSKSVGRPEKVRDKSKSLCYAQGP